MKIEFMSINTDGEEREWHLTPDELLEEWNSEECDLPMLDDTIVCCTFGGVVLYFETFKELVYVFLGNISKTKKEG